MAFSRVRGMVPEVAADPMSNGQLLTNRTRANELGHISDRLHFDLLGEPAEVRRGACQCGRTAST